MKLLTMSVIFLVLCLLVTFKQFLILTGPEIQSRWEWDFPHPSLPTMGPTQSPLLWVPAVFPGGKAAGAWRPPPTASNADVEERVEL